MRLILIYRPSEGGRLSRPIGTAVSVQPVSKAVYRSDFRELLSAAQFDSGPSPLTLQTSVITLDHCCDLQTALIPPLIANKYVLFNLVVQSDTAFFPHLPTNFSTATHNTQWPIYYTPCPVHGVLWAIYNHGCNTFSFWIILVSISHNFRCSFYCVNEYITDVGYSYTWDAVTSMNLNISKVRCLRRHLVCTIHCLNEQKWWLQSLTATSWLVTVKNFIFNASSSSYYRVAQKSKPPPIFQKIVLKIANEIRFLRKVKVWSKHYNIIRW